MAQISPVYFIISFLTVLSLSMLGGMFFFQCCDEDWPNKKKYNLKQKFFICLFSGPIAWLFGVALLAKAGILKFVSLFEDKKC